MVELLVTLVVTVFGLMGILAVHSSLTSGATISGQSQEAVAVGQQVMEKLRAVRPVLLSTEVTGGAAVPTYSTTGYTTVLGRNGISYTVDVSVSAPTPTLWLMHVDVHWTDDATGVIRTLPFELLRTSRESL